jgi:hypothetical protein
LVDPGLVGGRAEVVQCGVSTTGVVPALDPVEDRFVGRGPGGPGTSVEQLGLDGREERLGDGVVPALTATTDRQAYAVLVGQTPGTRSPGLLREESRGPFEDLHVLGQPSVLPTQPRQFLALGGSQSVCAHAGVQVGLTEPVADRRLGQIEVLGDLVPLVNPVVASDVRSCARPGRRGRGCCQS